MIDGIGKGGAGRFERLGGGQAAGGQRPVGGPVSFTPGKPGTVVADLVWAGPPVEGGKVEAIRAAIAEGRYRIDPQRIAERMIETDLPA